MPTLCSAKLNENKSKFLFTSVLIQFDHCCLLITFRKAICIQYKIYKNWFHGKEELAWTSYSPHLHNPMLVQLKNVSYLSHSISPVVLNIQTML